MVTVHSIDTIVTDPAIRRGQPIIAGTGVRVSDLVASYLYRSANAEELAANFGLNLAQVYAALAFYYQNKHTIDEQMRADDELAERLLAGFEAHGKLIRLE